MGVANMTQGHAVGGYVLGFREIDQTQDAVVGGKGAQLGELSRIEGVRVPAGFCVTTDAFRRIVAEAPSIDDRLERLSRLDPPGSASRPPTPSDRARRRRTCRRPPSPASRTPT
jgi:hypothetical protein